MHLLSWERLNPQKGDTSHVIAVFQCADDVVFVRIFAIEICADADTVGKRWPDFQCRLHMCLGFAFKAQTEIAGECKDDTSPSSTYVD